jgi:hypothetical protein
MPRKHTRKIKIRGGGDETPIQKQIREELERILLIFTVDTDVREKYTVSGFTDTISLGAKLIAALRDLYSSKSMKLSAKAMNRNELILRTIKLLINEPKMFRETSPNLGGYQHKYRIPVIPPPNIPLLDIIVGYSITIPSGIANFVGQCVGNLCNISRTITDEDAYSKLKNITEKINYSHDGVGYSNRYAELKTFFNDKNTVPSRDIAVALIKELKLFGFVESKEEEEKNFMMQNDIYVLYIDRLIKNNDLLYFISTLIYDLDVLGQDVEYDDEYIRNCIGAIEDVKENNQDGGANIRHRKKTIKKQRRLNMSTLLLKK